MKIQSVLIALFSFVLISLVLYTKMISQPVALLLMGVGFIVLIRHFKDEENELLTHLFK